jgi:hypothetical protein
MVCKMAGKKFFRRLVLGVALLGLVAGCADPGVLYQKQHADGRVDRLFLDGAEGWGDYDTTPRYHSQKPKDQDGYGIVMKKESTF